MTERCPWCGKDRYASRAAAKRSAWHQQQAGGRRLNVYRCPFCWDWHLTSKRPRRKRTPVRGHHAMGAG
jgi:hypothetical protein